MTHDQLFEYMATFFGLLNVYLITRQSQWNFLFGFLNAGCFFLLFHDKKIYADMSLHIIYMLFQIYGFYQWRSGGQQHHGVKAHYASWLDFGKASAVIVFLGVIMAYILAQYTDSTSIPLDASSTAISLVAQWMMSKKWIQNWWLWILSDVIGIAMYLYKGLYAASGLYAVYIVLCFIGLHKWRQSISVEKVLH